MQEKIKTSNWKHSFDFKYPGNGHIHIILKSTAFAKFVCSWTGPVHGCYILFSASLKRTFEVSQQDDSSLLLFQSDEETGIAQHNCDGADDNCQDRSSEDALLESYTSSMS